jgi:hypothetical protein
MVILAVLTGCSQQLVGNAQSTYESNEEYFDDGNDDWE